MTSGSPYSWFADEPVVVPDLAADFFATPLAHEPGSYFSYTGIGPYVAARALRAATGASVRDYLMPRVFGPLAIHNPQWHTCPLGHPVAESDLSCARPSWPASAGCCWTMAATRAASWSPPGTARGSPPKASPPVNDPEDQGFRLAPRYGLGAWCSHGDGTYSMAGRYGQLCIISPAP